MEEQLLTIVDWKIKKDTAPTFHRRVTKDIKRKEIITPTRKEV